jgi:two-component system chemotaxis response regulator CheB
MGLKVISRSDSGRSPTTVLAIAASAGGFEPLSDIIELLPSDLDLSVLIVVHISRSRPTPLAKLLSRVSTYDVTEAVDAQPLEVGHVYVAPPDHHLTVFRDSVRLTQGPRENRARPAADPLFRSIARWYGQRSIGLVLSGMRNDGASGLAGVHRRGGLALVQDPDEALFPPMPQAAIRANEPKVLSTPKEIVQAIDETARANVALDGSGARNGEFQTISENINEQTPADADEASQEGELTGLKCPDCGGSLWHRQKNGSSRYRCRVGHTLPSEILDEAQLDVLESTLWGAVVELEERADFLRRHQADIGLRDPQRWSEEIGEIELQAAQLRTLIPRVLSAGTIIESV